MIRFIFNMFLGFAIIGNYAINYFSDHYIDHVKQQTQIEQVIARK